MSQKKHSKILTSSEREAADRKELHAVKKHAPKVESAALVKLDSATRMLAEVRDMKSAKQAMDMAAVAEEYARKFQLGSEAELYAYGIRLDAQKMLGTFIENEVPKAKPGPKTELNSHEEINSRKAVYEELGVSPKVGAESVWLAGLDDETYQAIKTKQVKPSMVRRQQKRDELPAKVAALPEGKHRVIYADPPWKYGDERAGLEKEGTAAAAQYPLMDTEDLCAFAPLDRPVSDLAAKDSVLFMWATFPLLPDGLEVMAAWGFTYKQAFIWDKQRSNVANYHDASCEILLIGIRGSCPIEIDERVPQIISIARGKHSAKPEAFRDLIDKLYPTGPAIELFRRGESIKTKVREWKVWGNEAKQESAA